MAKYGSTGDAAKRKFGSDAGRQRIQERRDRVAEAREQTTNRTQAERGAGESSESTRQPKKRS